MVADWQGDRPLINHAVKVVEVLCLYTGWLQTGREYVELPPDGTQDLSLSSAAQEKEPYISHTTEHCREQQSDVQLRRSGHTR